MNLTTVILGLYLGSAALAWLTDSRHCRLLLFPALIGHSGQLLASSLKTGHLPVFTAIETLSGISLTIGWLTFFTKWHDRDQIPVRRFALTLIILLVAATCFWPPAAPCYDYNHSYPYAVAFHLFRRLALALALFAGAVFMAALASPSAFSESAAKLRYQGRNTIMAAMLIYLLSEDAGIIWCLRGWADIWHWSPNFVISTMVLIYLMLALHLPGGSRKPGRWYSLVGLSCGPLMLIAQLCKF